MALLSLCGVSLSFGGPRLLDQVDLQIEPGERLCLLGRNGEGKSSLLRLIRGEIEPDEGTIIRQQGLRISRLPQDVPEGHGGLSATRWPGDWKTTIITPAGTTIACRRSSPGSGSTRMLDSKNCPRE